MTSAVEEPKKFFKRDTIFELEKKARASWKEERVFEVDAPKPGEPVPEKWMGTFPYPYMNGRLHVGHAFSLSKLEFAAGYQRLKGKRVLMPFGFHCTGMPIKASADKIAAEVAKFGKDFSRFEKQVEETAAPVETPAEPAETASATDPTKIVKKQGKVVSKATGLKYQFQILKSMGVPMEEIHKFADPLHWLYFFPPLAMEDCTDFGLHVDWRRSFITTDVNPYYDSFIRWQFNKLREMDKIKFGERYTIYSPKDGQPCMDHDRKEGEGVGVQEYTAIKLLVRLDDVKSVAEAERDVVKGVPVGKKIASGEVVKALGGRSVYLVAATLRPETMYGQTNCFVGVDIDYGLYIANDKEAYVITERAARNMSWQGIFAGERGVLNKIAEFKGWDLVGLPLKAPLAVYDTVYTLPMEGVLSTKGTGVVTSVPSDSPDDYITVQDLMKKPAYYNILAKWIEPFLPPKPIIKAGQWGDVAAAAAVEHFKIKSQKDKKQLTEAKEAVYKEGFYNGVILVGKCAGRPVQEAKPIIRKQLIDERMAFAYCEPEGLVISRSDDECVVTLAEQWYMNYGEESWKADAKKCLERMELYGDETRHAFEKTLDWLSQWACSRSFGLGSRLPWDKDVLIESLSDSTIYMAYYTVAHLLHGGTLDGSTVGSANIKAEEMTDEVWSYIMLGTPLKSKSTIPQETLDLMRREFDYFYPLDLRVSGKDLINNHLTFFIYNHVAIFPESKWPRSIRANGHLLLNNAKMAKSTGNFLTFRDAINMYGADASRFALADAGDAIEDANLVEKTANDAILRLFNEKEWYEEILADPTTLRTGELNWHDKVFLEEIEQIITETQRAYEDTMYRKALAFGFYDLQNARNEYRKSVTGQGLVQQSDVVEKHEGLHKDVVMRFIEVQALLLAPICPHFCEFVWRDVLKNTTSIHHALWPKMRPVDKTILEASKYLRDVVYRIRTTEDAAAKKKNKKGGAPAVDPNAQKTLRLYVALKYPEWQHKAIEALKEAYNTTTKQFENEKAVFNKHGLLKNGSAMKFAAAVKVAVEKSGESAFQLALSFDEVTVLKQNLTWVRRELGTFKVSKVEMVTQDEIAAETSNYTEEDIKFSALAVPVCFEHRKNVCEKCILSDHEKCIVRSYLSWLQDNDFNPICEICKGPLSQGDVVRLTCLDLFHTECINNRCSALPEHTAPAGYACITCNTPIIPSESIKTALAEEIRTKFSSSKWASGITPKRIGTEFISSGITRSASASSGINNIASGGGVIEGAKVRAFTTTNSTSVAEFVPAIAPRVPVSYGGSANFVEPLTRKKSKSGRDEDDDKYSKTRADSQMNLSWRGRMLTPKRVVFYLIIIVLCLIYLPVLFSSSDIAKVPDRNGPMDAGGPVIENIPLGENV
ncbi:cytosolic leucyl tRNA synthetase [Nowakowskiella sp. JEL0407]|nr:cytosolic leucyl tRNA synthetase [Nowakowskiella sp. JEL0407]